MPGITLIAPKDVPHARAAAQRVVATHQKLAGWLRPGMTLAQIDTQVAKVLDDLGCRSCFYRYKARGNRTAFPSHACLSVNDCVVHGTAGYLTRPLVAGDVLKIDIGVWFEGWIGDAAWTYSIGKPTAQVRKLMDCGKGSLQAGIAALKPNQPWLHWAQAVQKYVEVDRGFHLVRGLGGHGIGRTLHGPPFVSNLVVPHHEWREGSDPIKPGTLVALEPMIAVSTGETRQPHGPWPICSADGSMTVHYEHDVLMTENGPDVLSAGLDDLNDVIQ